MPMPWRQYLGRYETMQPRPRAELSPDRMDAQVALVRPRKSAADTIADRTCMGCAVTFQSTGFSNRLCGRCIRLSRER